ALAFVQNAGFVQLPLSIHESAVGLAEIRECDVIGFREHLHGREYLAKAAPLSFSYVVQVIRTFRNADGQGWLRLIEFSLSGIALETLDGSRFRRWPTQPHLVPSLSGTDRRARKRQNRLIHRLCLYAHDFYS